MCHPTSEGDGRAHENRLYPYYRTPSDRFSLERIDMSWADLRIVFLLAAFTFAWPLPAAEIPLVCDRGDQVGNDLVPLGCGIPLKDGQADAIEHLAIKAGRKGLVPAQFEVRTRYPSGSIMWLWADFVSSAELRHAIVFSDANPATSLRAIGVRQTSREIVINNGSLELTWNRQYATPVRVSYLDHGAWRQIATGDGGGIYLIDNSDRKAILCGRAGELDWTIESTGKIRTVLRCEGFYSTREGLPLARAIVRYHIWRDQPEVKLEHTFVVIKDNDEVWYKELGVALPLAPEGKQKVTFSDARGVFHTEELQTGQEAWIFQKEFPVYTRTDRVCELGRDTQVTTRLAQSADWSALQGETGGLLLAVKDFAQQFPKEFCAGNGRLTAKLWSGRDGRRLDFHPKTMAADWWREWVDYANVESYNQKVPEAQPENIRSGKFNPSCVGVARTHTLYFAYFPATLKPAKFKDLAARFQAPPVICPDPRWTCHVDSRAFWQLAAKGEGGPHYEDIEAFISFWFEQFMMPQECFQQTGFYDWGWHPLLRYFKITEGGQVRIYPSWFRLNFCNIYALSKFLMIGWARSGDRRYLEAATRFTRYSSDYKFVHADGGRDKKTKGQIVWGFNHCLPTWRGSGTLRYGIDGDVVSPLALLYLLRDERWAKDTLGLYGAQMTKFPVTRTSDGGHPNVSLNHLMGVYRVFPTPELRTKIEDLFAGFTDPAGPGGMNRDWFAPGSGRSNSDYHLYKIKMKALSTMEYCDLFGYEGRNLEVLEKSARAAAIMATCDASMRGTTPIESWEAEKDRAGVIGANIVSACNYQDYYGATSAAVFRRDQQPDLYAVAQGQLEAVRQFWADYRKLPSDAKITAGFKSPGRNRHTSVYNAYLKSSGDRYPITFSAPTAGTAFLALPSVIWMLSAFAEPEWKRKDRE